MSGHERSESWSHPPGPPPGWGQPSGGPPPGPPRRDKSALVVILVALVVVAVGIGAFLVTRGDDGAGDEVGSTAARSSEGEPTTDETSEDTSAGDEQVFVEAIAYANEVSSQGLLTTDGSRCIAEATVNVVGVDALQAATTPDEIRGDVEATLSDLGVGIDQAATDQLAADISECMDMVQYLLDYYAQDGVPQEIVDCIEANIDADLAATFIAAGYVGTQEVSDASEAEFNAAVAPCEPSTSGWSGHASGVGNDET